MADPEAGAAAAAGAPRQAAGQRPAAGAPAGLGSRAASRALQQASSVGSGAGRADSGSTPSSHAARQKLNQMLAQQKVLGGEAGVQMAEVLTITEGGREQIAAEQELLLPRGVIHPFNHIYRVWWWITIAAAIVTGWIVTYHIAFATPSMYPIEGGSIVQLILLAIFCIDILVSFTLSYYDREGRLVADRRRIVVNYVSFRLWWDLMSTLPWDDIALAARGLAGVNNQEARYLSLLGLLKLGRLYRVGRLFQHLELVLALGRTPTVLVRDAVYAFFVVHWAGCMYFFIARQELGVGITSTWTTVDGAGVQLGDVPVFHLYIYSVFWSLSVFNTQGYGDFTPYSIAEVAFVLVYLAFNVFFWAYILATITLLVFRSDELHGGFRDRLRGLEAYARTHQLPKELKAMIQDHLFLHHIRHETNDDILLSSLPTTLKRRLLRHQYGEQLQRCWLLQGVSPRFIDALLCAASVETFMPKVDLLADGDYANQITIIVAGYVEQFASTGDVASNPDAERAAISDTAHYSRTPQQVLKDMQRGDGASAGSDYQLLGPGDVYGAYSFFTGATQLELCRTLTVSRVLSVSRSTYAAIAADFPNSAKTVLDNLQRHAETQVQQEFRGGAATRLLRTSLTTAIQSLQYQNASADSAGAAKHDGASTSVGVATQARSTVGMSAAGLGGMSARQQQVVGNLQRVRTLVKNQVAQAGEARTGQFLSACSNGQADRVRLFLGQGFDVNSADYDGRTGLMLAAEHGHKPIVDILLAVNARASLRDNLGGSALLGACKRGHDDIIEVLLHSGAKLGLEPLAQATALCGAVSTGDLTYLRRLLTCGAGANCGDYDKRTALHVAASNGNLQAVKVLVEEGSAEVDAVDRSGDTPLDEAHAAHAALVVEYLEGVAGEDVAAAARTKFHNRRAETFLRACSQNDTKGAQAHLNRGCPPDCADYDARTGLMVAAAKGHTDVVMLLLNAGANPNARDNLGGCALLEAAKAGHSSIMRALRARGALLNLGPGELASVLCNAVYARDGALLLRYAEAGADLDSGDYDKRCALHIAAAEGDLEMVKLLVGAGASPHVRDRWGHTPGDEAKRVGAKDVVDFLARAMVS